MFTELYEASLTAGLSMNMSNGRYTLKQTLNVGLDENLKCVKSRTEFADPFKGVAPKKQSL